MGRPALAAVIVLGVLIAVGIVIVVTAGSSGPLSRGRHVTASSEAGREFRAASVTDGDTTTAWAPVEADSHWLTVDLGEASTFRQVVLDWDQKRYASQFEIVVSNDGEQWTAVGTAYGFAGRQVLNVTGSGRYVRVLLKGAVAVREVEVYSESAPACAGGEVARGRPASASSVETGDVTVDRAFDGKPDTRWSSVWGDPQFLQVDLGTVMPVCRIALNWEAAYATAYDLQISKDGESWTALYSTTTGKGGTETIEVAGGGRYVRLLLRARAGMYGFSLWEVGVETGTPTARPISVPVGAATNAPLSYRKPAQASSTTDTPKCSRCDAAWAVDFNSATRWMSGEPSTKPAWLRVDLGAPAAVDRVHLQWADEYARAYTIEVSTDAQNWAEIYRTDRGDGHVDDVQVEGRGRYIRVSATTGADPRAYSLWEFQVYGLGGDPLSPPPRPDIPQEPYELVWSDDFDGAAGQAPDAAKWRPETGPGVTGELQYYTDNKNTRLDGAGNLIITVRREVTPDSTCPLDAVSGSVTCQYTSGRINTSGLFSFTYGRVEARIKLSGTQGLWPAFWMLGEDLYTGKAPWPEAGEIDIMEYVGGKPNQSSSALHASAYNGANGIGAVYYAGSNLSADFHTYSVEWLPDRITFAVDGKKYHTVDRDVVERTRGPWVYNRPFVLLLNNAIGGPFPGPPGKDTRLPQDLVIDYVRVFR